MKRFFILICLVLTTLTIEAVENYPYRSDYLWLTVPDHADWLYKTGEKAKVEVSFCKYGMPQNVEVNYEIGQGDITTMSVRQRQAISCGT